MPVVAKWIKDEVIGEGGSPDDVVIVSPDAGGAKRADKLAKKLGCAIAIFSKNREKANEVAKMVRSWARRHRPNGSAGCGLAELRAFEPPSLPAPLLNLNQA